MDTDSSYAVSPQGLSAKTMRSDLGQAFENGAAAV